MLGLVRHARACPRFSKITKQQYLWEGFELFCLFVAWSYTSKEATVLSCCFRWVWSSMPKDLWSKKSPISLERVEWFCRFFASSHLHLLRYSLKLQKYAIFGYFWFFASIEARRNMLFWVMTPKYSWPISLQDTFGLLDLLNLILGIQCYTVFVSKIFGRYFTDVLYSYFIETTFAAHL